jgi:hypothetical protein
MNTTAGDGIARYRRELRAGLLALGAPLAAIGAWALLAPRSWYDDFPGGGLHWVPAFGPYNEHFVRDFGALYLALGLLLGYAAVVLGRALVRGALGALLVFSVPHFIVHLTKLDALSTGDNVANMALLGLSIVVPVALLALTAKGEALDHRGVRSERRATRIKGGPTHATR